jgi:hypothetical protein
MPAAAGAPGATAACGRSEDSAGHTPLPKRGPHLCKRPPLAHPAAPAWGFRALARAPPVGSARGAAARLGRAAVQAPRARACTTPDSGGIADTRPATAPRPPAPSRHHRIERAPADARPRLPPPVLLPTPLPRPGRFPPRRLDCSPTGSHNTHQPTHHTLPLPRCRRPAPRPPAPAWAGPPRFTWRVEEGGPAQPRWPPFLESPGGKRKTGRRRGGGPFALKTNPYRRTPRDEQQERTAAGSCPRLGFGGSRGATRRAR